MREGDHQVEAELEERQVAPAEGGQRPERHPAALGVEGVEQVHQSLTAEHVPAILVRLGLDGVVRVPRPERAELALPQGQRPVGLLQGGLVQDRAGGMLAEVAAEAFGGQRQDLVLPDVVGGAEVEAEVRPAPPVAHEVRLPHPVAEFGQQRPYGVEDEPVLLRRVVTHLDAVPGGRVVVHRCSSSR
ncbi:hypothetical protein OG344_16720 [Microbispora sp. NBC_01389]